MEDVIDSTVEEVVESTEKSMDDTIRETLAEIESRGTEPEETTEQKADRLRDEQGRFAKNAAPDQTPEDSEPPPAVEAQPDPVAAPSVPPDLQRLGLRKEEADAFAKADPAVQAAFIRRSDEMHKGIEQFRSKAQFGHEMEQAIAPFSATIQALGVHPAKAVNNLLVADHALRYGSPQQKMEMFNKIAREYGIDPATIPQQEPQYVDPNVSQLQTQLQQMQSWILQRNAAEQQREQQALNSEIAGFANDPANKHFQAVKLDMAGLLQSGMAKDLKDAYEKAIYANPTVRAQVLAEQHAQAEAQRKAQFAQKAQAAKTASSVNIPRRGITPAKGRVGSMDETIRAEAERLGLF